MLILLRVGGWYSAHQRAHASRPKASTALPFDRRTTIVAFVVLMLLTFTKNIYTAGMGKIRIR